MNIRSLSTGGLPAGCLTHARIAAMCSQALSVRSRRTEMSCSLLHEMTEGNVQLNPEFVNTT